jgi:hypothetical protein
MTTKKTATKNGGGPPKLYEKRFDNMAYVACTAGIFTDAKLGKLFGVVKSTIALWKKEFPEFSDSIKKGKEEFDTDCVRTALFKISKGIKFTEITREAKPVILIDKATGTREIVGSEMLVTKKVRKFIPPNDRAIRFWLKNRDPENWRDTQAVELTGKNGGPLKTQSFVAVPSGPMTIAEWEKQVREALEHDKNPDSDSDDDNDRVLDTATGTAS